jgi:hypothetical protein
MTSWLCTQSGCSYMHARCIQRHVRPRKRYSRLSVRLHEDKLDLAKTPRVEDWAHVGIESSGSKLVGVVEESVSVTLGDSL